jgi:hypothetical protein
MYRPRRSFVLSCLLALLAAGALRAQAPEPAALQAAIAGARLEPARAVALKGVKLAVGLGTLRLDDGVLIPAAAVGGKTIEMVFLGKGRLEIEPPDAIEGGQLELFTGGSRLNAEFKQAVLVVGQDAAVAAMLRKPAAQPDAAQVHQAEALYADWRKKGEWKYLSAERGILLNALRDPVALGYFAAWFRGGELGDISYCVDPGVREQVTLGHFVPLEATEREKRKILKAITREQRKGRMVGVELDDLGQWDTWLSSSLRTGAGKLALGAPTFEPKKYTLDVTLEERELRLTGKARIELQPVIAGSRAVALTLPGDFQVSKVTDAGGAPLFSLRTGGQLTVVLPQAPPSGGTAAVVVEYAGRPVDKDWNLFTLLDTMGWYPHAGAIDRASYDVTFHWPKGLELIASGRRMDGGESPDGSRWEHRTMNLPGFGFSFEVGRFKIQTARAGHVEVRVAFGSGTTLGGGARDDVMKTVTDSLQFYEQTFGPYPLDELTVTTANRDFSQGMLGFITLSNGVVNHLQVGNPFYGVEDRRLVIAHEIAHQWWGDQVGWTSYRDQWISEAMASYAALLYGKERLHGVYYGGDLVSGWQRTLTSSLPDGRALESIGPVVLGSRLFSSHSDNAYQAIVYDKGALILNMLARGLGEEIFPKVLRQVLKVSGTGTISTEELFALIERITGSDLNAFTRQFVYGTGLPEVLYSYTYEKKGNGWVVKGVARQQTPQRYRYKVVKTPRDTFDVSRQVVPQLDVKQSSLVVPVDVEVYDPKEAASKGKNGANSTVKGNILVKGESTDFEIAVEHDPKAFWLDRHSKVFGLFFDEGRHPKRTLYYRALKAGADGKAQEAVALYDKALAIDEPPPDNGETVYYADLQYAKRVMNAQIELGRARLLLDQGRDDDADAALGKASYLLGDLEEFTLLKSRLDVRRGNYDKAFQRLRKGLKPGADALDSSEGYALLAISARATGHKEELDKALKKARENGADVSALAGS